jgi:molecular chaperone DnaK
MSIFSNDYCRYITTSVYSAVGGESFTETDLRVFQRSMAEWCKNNQLVADATIDGDKILIRAGHFSEDAGPGMQTTIFRDIARDVGREIDKGFGFSIKETIKNPYLHHIENDSAPVSTSGPRSKSIVARTRIEYGIDLGTTNSAIARLEGNEALIFKSDVQKDTVPSCVHYRKGTILVGDRAYNRYSDEKNDAFKGFSIEGDDRELANTFAEFKRTMGTDKTYSSESAGRSFTSEELSAEVLKFLKSLVRDEEIPAVVITVPSRFHSNQVDATQAAAELAGFEYCELLQEPIAASIAYGISKENINGYWIVFDYGGGTFDVALMRVEEGIMQVVDTDGDPHLGGKDIDFAIIDKIFIPELESKYSIGKILASPSGKAKLRDALKFIAEEAKIAISPPGKLSAAVVTYKPIGEDDDGEEIELDFQMTLDAFEKAISPEIQRAIDISKKLTARNNIKDDELERVVLVGGSTLSQTLRKLVREQFNTTIDTSVDPMTAVAKGAAIYASARELPTAQQKRDTSKIQLILKYPNTTVESTENLGLRIDREKTTGAVPQALFVEVTRSDNGWSSNKVKIEDDAEIIEVFLEPGSNTFEIVLLDEKGNRLVCEPSSISVLQGLKTPEATLPYDVCVAGFLAGSKRPLLLDLGLVKNRTLPAKGSITLRTQKDVRPGSKEDVVRFPIFEGETNTAEIHNLHVSTILVTGEDIGRFLPKDSEVKIDLEVDASRRITFRAFFPDIDETIERTVDRTSEKTANFPVGRLEEELRRTQALAEKVQDESESANFFEVEKLTTELSDLSEMLKNGADSDAVSKVTERLRAAAKELDTMESDDEFPKAKTALEDQLDDLKETNERFGNKETAREVARLERMANDAINSHNIAAVRDLTEQMDFLAFRLRDEGAGPAIELGFIQHFDQDFETVEWTNPHQARKLIDQAKEIIISGDISKEKLRPLVQQIAKLLPEREKENLSGIDDSYLTK